MNSIPDLKKNDGIVFLKNILKGFDTIQIKKLVTYGAAYPPKVRALLGALLEELKINFSTYDVLKRSMNPSSSFEYGINSQLLPTVNSWNIT